MAKYYIHIRESIDKGIEVEADSKEQAMTQLRNSFLNGDIVLSKENDHYSFDMYGNGPYEN